MDASPLIFRPILKEKVWGGGRMGPVAGRDLPPGAKVGESWDISDRPGDMSVVSEGPNAGSSLDELFRADPRALLGEPAGELSDRFPLLVKLLDARETLSVQVHPDDAYAAAHQLPDMGKTEAWYILHADPGAVMFKGIRPEITREQFAAMIEQERVEEALHAFAVRRDDVILCPAGTVHAIGAGLVLFEVQQNSDTTYRVYDWGRKPDGKPRPLHVKEALEVIRFGEASAERAAPQVLAEQPFRRERMVECEKFVMERWTFTHPADVAPQEDELAIMNVVDGAGVVRGGGVELSVRRGATFLLPACLRSWRIQPDGRIVLLRSTLPHGRRHGT